MQERIGVAQDLQVDPAKGSVDMSAGRLDRLPENVQARQKVAATGGCEVAELPHADLVHQQDAVAGQPLHLTDHGEGLRQPRHHGRVLAPEG